MIFLLSPAKTLDYETPLPDWAGDAATRPRFVPRSAELIAQLKQLAPAEVARMMGISPALADLNVERYAAWSTRFTAKNSRPAAFAFDGDVYLGLDAKRMSESQLRWAQSHLAILSGLYGLLRPLDRMQPYRLEMGTALATRHGRNLYDFWGATLAKAIDGMQSGERECVVVNLASQEYAKAVDRRALDSRIVDCVFEDEQPDGRHAVVGFFAKRARGAMARQAIERRWSRVESLRGFDRDGYAFAVEASSADRLVFRRALEARQAV